MQSFFGMAAIVDPHHRLTSPQQRIIRQQLLVEMFATCSRVPSDNDDDRLYDESSMPKLTKRRRFEDCIFLDGYMMMMNLLNLLL